jgi:nucleotide-binding universal stress UspA family protein
MDKILVAIDGRHSGWEALSHACSLAQRIHVDLNVLLVIAPDRRNLPQAVREVEEAVKKRLALLIETAKAEGITINYFLTEGTYEDEVINFVNNHKIALLVLEHIDGDARSASKDSASLRALRHRLTCKMEVVAPMKNIPEYIERIP